MNPELKKLLTAEKEKAEGSFLAIVSGAEDIFVGATHISLKEALGTVLAGLYAISENQGIPIAEMTHYIVMAATAGFCARGGVVDGDFISGMKEIFGAAAHVMGKEAANA